MSSGVGSKPTEVTARLWSVPADSVWSWLRKRPSTYTRERGPSTTTPVGPATVDTRASSAPEALSTPSLDEPSALTYTRWPSGDHATPLGMASDESRSDGGPFGTE